MSNFFQLLFYVWKHPSNRGAGLSALLRIIRWQISSRLMPSLISIPFLNGTHLFAKRGMTSASSVWYCGLYDYEEMSFLSHYLKPGNLFVDIGANIGAYSILAASVGAKVIAIEPIPSTFKNLERNILLNNFKDYVEVMNIAISNKKKNLRLSSNVDALNHVLIDGESTQQSIEVRSDKLDDILNGRVPQFLKIDVEGFETNVVESAEKTFANKGLLGVIIELIGAGKNYGFNEDILHQKILSFGFDTYSYCPQKRELLSLKGKRNRKKNTLYLRNDFRL